MRMYPEKSSSASSGRPERDLESHCELRNRNNIAKLIFRGRIILRGGIFFFWGGGGGGGVFFGGGGRAGEFFLGGVEQLIFLNGRVFLEGIFPLEEIAERIPRGIFQGD